MLAAIQNQGAIVFGTQFDSPIALEVTNVVSQPAWARTQCCMKATQLQTKPLKKNDFSLGLLDANAKKVFEE